MLFIAESIRKTRIIHSSMIHLWTIMSIQAAITKYHQLGGLNKQTSFLTVLEAWKSRTAGSQKIIPGEDPLLGLQTVTVSSCDSMISFSFLRILIPSQGFHDLF